MEMKELHEKAMRLVQNIKNDEIALFNLFQEIDRCCGYREFGFPSLWAYATQKLGLSESRASALISVRRKSETVPELRAAIQSGELTVSQGKRILKVIETEPMKWIEKAKEMKQKDLEREVAIANPKAAVKEKMTFIQAERVKLECGISEELMKQITRAQDLVSKSKAKPASLEDTIAEMTRLYLERKDPVKKAERVLTKTTSDEPSLGTLAPRRRKALRAAVQHEVNQRDQGKCRHRDAQGRLCLETKWVQIHHRVEVCKGGLDTPDNLITLCASHHRAIHRG